MPSPAAAGVIASTIYLFPDGPRDRQFAFAALAMVVVPALLMVSTIRFRSVKAIDVGWQRSYLALFLLAVALALIASHPRIALVCWHTATPSRADVGLRGLDDAPATRPADPPQGTGSRGVVPTA